MAHYGGEDERINKGIPATEKAMKQHNKSYTYKLYPGAQHAFNFGQIEFAEWTPDGHLRDSKFVGLRDDKDARSVTREDN